MRLGGHEREVKQAISDAKKSVEEVEWREMDVESKVEIVADYLEGYLSEQYGDMSVDNFDSLLDNLTREGLSVFDCVSEQ